MGMVLLVHRADLDFFAFATRATAVTLLVVLAVWLVLGMVVAPFVGAWLRGSR